AESRDNETRIAPHVGMAEELKQGSKLGNYELVLRIGRGGMAAVWVARERAATTKDDRLVAVKVMLTELADEGEFVKMFLDEVRLVRSIRHPNVVDVYDVGEDEGTMWMSMEWVEGESLHTVIAEAGKRRAIPPELAVRIIADAAAGLHAAHELRELDGSLRGVVHRDISPHNILIGTNGSVKLVDFGVAKAVGRISEATRAGQLKGKFGYMSPEQALGKSVDRRSDIFSLGIVLFELTTSRRLFRGEHDVETLRLVISGGIPKPTQIDSRYPPELERIVLKALERNVSARYQTAAELEHDLRAYLKAERLIVPQGGIAGILKRVLGERIEQRRKAVRASLKALNSGALPGSDLLPNDPAFTPTGKDRITVSGVSTVTGTGLSGLSGLSGAGTSPSALLQSPLEHSQVSHPNVPRVMLAPRLSTASVLGYAIGVAGLAIALFVLIFMR
ncbi:MAG TPA: serine/threonine-protein kinase, partial [Polyangiaceae bacterium]|nr:serine/threonine-protein kinase [Polyangiaceae bacterium]